MNVVLSLVRDWYPNCTTVNGRPRRPSDQGSIERTNGGANVKTDEFPSVAAARRRLYAAVLAPAMETVVMGQIAHKSSLFYFGFAIRS